MTKGTKEWSDKSYNIQLGCENNCVYCYAKQMLKDRFNIIEKWDNPIINMKKVKKNWRKSNGVIMFPTSHDITDNNFLHCFEVIEKMLKSNNKILVVTKSGLKPYWIRIINYFKYIYEKQLNNIEFRISITYDIGDKINILDSCNSTTLERLDLLKYLHSQGINTSVSCEPFLGNIKAFDNVYGNIIKYTTGDIWYGIMNHIDKIKCENDNIKQELENIKSHYSYEDINKIYIKYKDKIKFKDSVYEKLKIN